MTKAVDAGKKGVTAKIIHEKNVASKIEIQVPAEEEGGVRSRAVGRGPRGERASRSDRLVLVPPPHPSTLSSRILSESPVYIPLLISP